MITMKGTMSICNSVHFSKLFRVIICSILAFGIIFFHACNSKQGIEGSWDFEIFFDEEPILGTLKYYLK